MRTLPSTILLCCISLLLIAGITPVPAAATNAAPARPRAVFVTDVSFGRDPFFPASTRRGQPAIQPSTNAPAFAVNASFALKGISGTRLQPLALINNTTVAEGEVADIRSGARSYKVRCVEIRDRSVLIEIVATRQVQELRLREGI